MEKREFIVETPLGKLKVWAKHKIDSPKDYPGVYVDFVDEDGYSDLLACVEYDSGGKHIHTCVFGEAGADEPTVVVVHKLDPDEDGVSQ